MCTQGRQEMVAISSIETEQLIIRNGGNIFASTSDQGAAGNLAIAASEKVELIGTTGDGQNPSGLFSLVLRGATGDGGNLILDTKKLTVRDGAQISAATFGQGSGGILAITALDSVELSGKSSTGDSASGLFSSAQLRSTGASGNISLTTGQLLIQDQAKVTVSSPNSAKAGNVLVTANSLSFNNQGKLIAETAAADGGNIRIQGANLILMRGNSLISATAGGLGNGGNLDIDSQFLVAIPQENNDIIANAFEGRGGTIQIAAKSIFGLQYRQHQTSASDITASSKFGTSGTVQINTPTVDPTKGLINLSTNLVNAEALVSQSCQASVNSQASKLIVTGLGGLPPSPNETLNSETVLVDLGLASLPKSPPQVVTSIDQNSKPHVALVEAQGWVTNANGQIILTANLPTATPHNSWQTPTRC